ncbi:MAG: hypothetical protein IJD39_11140 [Clostridia bacterium]|nr:hypothetical protein [Clostridia bacterium]
MQIYMEGQDTKAAYLTELLQNTGHEIVQELPADLIILSLPRSAIPLEQLSALPKGQKLLCGLTNPAFDQMAKEKEWQLFRILSDELYIRENALLSAEGALFYAMRASDRAIRDLHCLVVGYGRIGKALTQFLRSLGAEVTVAARRKESREEAGANSISIDDIKDLLPAIPLIFNTVPAPVIDKNMLSLVPEDGLLMELASLPYGIDLAAAHEMGLRAWGEWGIPGRYCPGSAAHIQFDYLKREVFK